MVCTCDITSMNFYREVVFFRLLKRVSKEIISHCVIFLSTYRSLVQKISGHNSACIPVGYSMKVQIPPICTGILNRNSNIAPFAECGCNCVVGIIEGSNLTTQYTCQNTDIPLSSNLQSPEVMTKEVRISRIIAVYLIEI